MLPSETGRVLYQFTKPGLRGTAQFSWIQQGARFRVEVQGKGPAETVLGQGKQLFMLSPANQWHPDTAQRVEVKPTDVWLNAEEMPYVIPGSGAGTVVGTGTVLGKPCEIRKLHSMKIWYWQGLPLRMERPATARMKPLSLVATRLDTELGISPSYFKLPAGYQVSDFPGRDPIFPWTAVATTGLMGMLLLIGICIGVVECAFARRGAMTPASG